MAAPAPTRGCLRAAGPDLEGADGRQSSQFFALSLDAARSPIDAELTGLDDAFRHVVSGALTPDPIGTVGLELEMHLVDLARPATRVSWDRLTTIVAALPPLPAGSVVTLEPGGCIIGAVRSATVGMPIEDSAVAPFSNGEWLLSHNGRVDRAVLPPDAAAESTCDAAMLAALVFATGLMDVGEVVASVGAKDPAARLNLLLVNGSRILATTWGDTLGYLVTADGVAVASEPYDDDPQWVDVPDRHLVDVTAAGLSITALETT